MAKNRGKKRLLAGLLICAALAFALMRAFANLNGALLSLAEARAEQRALQQISLALDEVMHKSLDYEDFVDVHYDAEGEASMLSANTILMNRIAADAATAAQENIDTLADEGITLPLGSALGSGVFSGKGPRLRFEILPVGTVKTAFVTEFESAGINQTRHKISLEATASVRIVLPSGARTVSVRASALMPRAYSSATCPSPTYRCRRWRTASTSWLRC